MIVLERAKWATTPEAIRRLWHRRPWWAVLVAANVVALLALNFAVLFGPPFVGFLLTESDCWAWRAAGIAIGITGPPLAGLLIRRWPHAVRTMAWLMVGEAVKGDPVEKAALTRREREAVEKVRAALAEVGRHAAVAAKGRPHSMRDAAVAWSHIESVVKGSLSRLYTPERLTLIERLIRDGIRFEKDPDAAALYGAVLVRVAAETSEAVERLLRGEPVGNAAEMWGYVYEKGRRDDEANQGGRPASLERWLREQEEREGGPTEG